MNILTTFYRKNFLHFSYEFQVIEEVEVDTLPIIEAHQTVLIVVVGAVEMAGIVSDTIVIHGTGALAPLWVAVEGVTNPV